MRAPLGLLMILVGAVMGYLVLIGRLPSSSPLLGPAQAQPPAGGIHGKGPGSNGGNGNPQPNPTPPGGGIGGPHPTGSGGPYYSNGDHSSTFGLPTLLNLQDMNASTGVYT